MPKNRHIKEWFTIKDGFDVSGFVWPAVCFGFEFGDAGTEVESNKMVYEVRIKHTGPDLHEELLGLEFPGGGEKACLFEIRCLETLPDDGLRKKVKKVMRHSANVVVIRTATDDVIL